MNIPEQYHANIMILTTPDDLKSVVKQSVNDAMAEHAAKQQPPTPNPDKLYTIADLMKRFEVSRITIWQWQKKGLLQSTRIGNLKRFAEKDIQAFIKIYNPSK